MNVTLVDIYADACAVYGQVPSQAGLDAWDSVLREYQAHEVKRALQAWQANTTEILDFTKRMRGAVMPAPSELKALALRARREERRIKYCSECCDGIVTVTQEGCDGKVERAFGICACVRAWSAARNAARNTVGSGI